MSWKVFFSIFWKCSSKISINSSLRVLVEFSDAIWTSFFVGNYKINVSKGLGNVTLDGQKLEMDRVYGTGENYLDVDGGIGEIKIDSKEQ